MRGASLWMLVLLGCAQMAGCSDGDRQEVEKMKMKTKNSIFDKPFDKKLNEQNMEEMKKAELKHTAEVEKIKEAARAKTLTESERGR